MGDEEDTDRTNTQSLLFFGSLTMIMISGTAQLDLLVKLAAVGFFSLLTAYLGFQYYSRDELRMWMDETYEFVKMIFPVLLLGVFASGVLKPLIPQSLIASLTGQNTILANTIAALFGTIAYFPTLVEVPVANLFLELGMHHGPLMSYLLVDPGVSLQTLLVVNAIIKPKKTAAYAFYMLAFGIIGGYLYGLFM